MSFIAGLAHLFVLRFESGDIYPPYSSLRTDPLGVKAFYESLENIKGFEISRNYEQEDKIDNPHISTVFYFGMKSLSFYYLSEKEVKMLEGIAAGGGRIVFCLMPQSIKESECDNECDNKNAESKKEAEETKETEQTEKSKKPEKEDSRFTFVELASRWKFDTGVQQLSSATSQAFPSPAFASKLPQSISWHSLNYFLIDGTEWIPVYEVNGHPVIIERKFGQGSIVLSGDSYFVSNEALVKERHPELLAWLSGSHKKIVFDETHLGLRENKGIASLFRKYNLHGFLIAILVLGILFVWRNAFSLVPAEPDEKNKTISEIAEGRDSLSGFIGMLKRNVSPDDLLSICLEEWEKTIKQGNWRQNSKKENVKTLILEQQGHHLKEKKIIATYNKISKILAERKYS
jgi:hypothetical protein